MIGVWQSMVINGSEDRVTEGRVKEVALCVKEWIDYRDLSLKNSD